MADSYHIFDRKLVLARAQHRKPEALFLFEEGAGALQERLSEVNRDFKKVLTQGPCLEGVGIPVPDVEALDVGEGVFDLALSNLVLHWANDLPGALVQIRRALKPDGLFLGVMLGGDTLIELRQSLLEAEIEITGGASPRVSPFADIRDAGGLLQRAGFAMPVADIDKVSVSYDNPLKLMKELRAMGETNALLERAKTVTPKAVLMRAAAIYEEKFSDKEGRVCATFDFLHLAGWAPGPDQPKPLKPGTAKVNLNQVFGKKP